MHLQVCRCGVYHMPAAWLGGSVGWSIPSTIPSMLEFPVRHVPWLQVQSLQGVWEATDGCLPPPQVSKNHANTHLAAPPVNMWGLIRGLASRRGGWTSGCGCGDVRVSVCGPEASAEAVARLPSRAGASAPGTLPRSPQSCSMLRGGPTATDGLLTRSLEAPLLRKGVSRRETALLPNAEPPGSSWP